MLTVEINDLIKNATEIVAAYVSRNEVPSDQLSDVISTVYRSLQSLNGGDAAPPAEPLVPAVSIKKSVHPDYIICLEDGKRLKMLKRHLRSTYNMTPDEYRAKWSLPPDYPMVCSNYSEKRSRFAREIGLGTKGRRAAE
jgi:predicted transcriptional regulator